MRENATKTPVTPDALYAAHSALDAKYGNACPQPSECFVRDTHTSVGLIVEAAAPLIAAAALQPVRDALANHPRCEEHPDEDVITCGWKTAVLDVQRALEARNG